MLKHIFYTFQIYKNHFLEDYTRCVQYDIRIEIADLKKKLMTFIQKNFFEMLINVTTNEE